MKPLYMSEITTRDGKTNPSLFINKKKRDMKNLKLKPEKVFPVIWGIMFIYIFLLPREKKSIATVIPVGEIKATEIRVGKSTPATTVTKERQKTEMPKQQVTKKENEKLIADIGITLYQPVVGQCDSDPLITADGSKINLNSLNSGNLKWIAVSQDLIKSKKVKYGDKVRVVSDDPTIDGIYYIHDTMNKKWRNRIDILISPNRRDFGHGKWEGKLYKMGV